MTSLVLRRGTVAEAAPPAGAEQRLVVDVPGRGPRPAIADIGLVGAAQRGDDVVVNTQAADLALGSGGFDVVHVNLSRGLDGDGLAGAHVMKLNYSPLQHAVLPVEGPELGVPLRRPVAVISLHGQRAAGGHSRVVADLRARGLLAGFLTAGPAYGGEGEAITTAGAVHHGLHDLRWDAAVCGPGPGILGSASALGHGGLAALDSAHAALALGCEVVLGARMSSGDPRPRHHGLSHHARTVLELLLAPVTVPVPPGCGREVPRGTGHEVLELDADVEGYAASGLSAPTMGRGLGEDRLFFAAALAAGEALAAKIGRHER